MKRLGVFVCIAIATISLFGSFTTPQKTFAQVTAPSPEVQNQKIRQDLQAKADKAFSDFISRLQSKQDNPKSIPSLANASDQIISQYVQGNKDLISVVRGSGGSEGAQQTFNRLFSSPSAPSTNIYADFTAAISAAQLVVNNGQTGFATIRQNPLLRQEVSEFAGVTGSGSVLNNLAQEKQRELIATGKADEALALQSAAGAQRTQQELDKTKSQCGLLNIGICITEAVTWIIKSILLEIAGFLVWLSANMLNYSVKLGILEFSTWAPDALYPIWIIIRQILSLAIVFAGLYLGFIYILGDKDGKFERYIPWVIMFGLFVNFSYPLTRTAIDISNVVSLKIYTSTFGTETLSGSSSNTPGALIVDKLGLQGLAVSATAVSKDGGILKNIEGSIPGALAAVAFVFYAAYVLFMATALIIMRTVSLVFIIVASPILLVDSVIPMLGEQAKKLRGIFFGQLIVGPVFMILLALTLKFLDVFGKNFGTNVGITGMGTGTAPSVITFFNILMMIIMLHITLKVTKETSGKIGTFATEKLGTIGGFGLGVAAGGAGLLARGSLGRLATKARDSKWVTNNQDSFLGRRAYELSNSVSKSTFDLRNSKVVAGQMSKIGMGMGMGRKLNYEEASDARVKDKVERAARIKTRFERDVFAKDALGRVKKDDKGQAILLHKKGDVDTDAEAAKLRYLQNNGGALFSASKKEKDAIDDSLTKELTEANKKIEGEIGGESSEDVKKYNTLKDQKSKDDFVRSLYDQLGELKKTDHNLMGNKAKAIEKTLREVGEKEKQEKKAFDKRVSSVFAGYYSRKEEDRAAYLSDQEEEVQGAVRTRIANQGQQQPETAQSTDIDLDLNEPYESVTVETIKEVSFAERAAAKRKASQAGSAAKARQEMATNAGEINRNASPAAPTTTPTQPTAPPVPPATPAPRTPTFDTSSLDNAGLVPKAATRQEGRPAFAANDEGGDEPDPTNPSGRASLPRASTATPTYNTTNTTRAANDERAPVTAANDARYNNDGGPSAGAAVSGASSSQAANDDTFTPQRKAA